ncbi:MAG: hypothetical protein CMJ64_17595 [Planctomycetaceae bacterium]|nr:hypothetical protein [Planctomycetaceae bacterium]
MIWPISMTVTHRWRKEPGSRVQGSRPLDELKVQAPCVVRVPAGGYRIFYTAIGPAKPYATCQGYILSAFSGDGLQFNPEPGIRVAPQPAVPHMALRVLSPTVARCVDGGWRMYFESRGSADRPTVICSAVSDDLLHWKHEDGIRLAGFDGVGGPRYLVVPDGHGRIYCFASEGVEDRRQSIVSAASSDGLNFEFEPGYRLRDRQAEHDTAGITAADVIAPQGKDDRWTMLFSAWQDVPAGTEVPLHPSRDPDAANTGLSEDFAAASIASDMAGYRSRIYTAHSRDGLNWKRAGCVIEGGGYNSEELDAVHSEDMSLVEIEDGQYRMYYAACDCNGNWRIASAVSRGSLREPDV